MKAPSQAQDRRCKDRQSLNFELKSSLPQVRNNHYFLKSGQVGGGRQVGGSGARSSCQYYECTCAATCPHTHLLNNHPAQQDLLPLECVNHVSHTVALITARYVIAFILMCYFPAARP